MGTPGQDAADGVISVHFPWMTTAAEDVRACHNTLIQQQEELKGFLSRLQSDWQGVGGESWSDAQQRWHNAADGIYIVLGQLYQALTDAHINYTTSEKAIEGFWNS
jgi:WXG100 family type VII secretion target